MVGSGVLDYGNIGVMPITKNPTLLLVLIALHEWRTHTQREDSHTAFYLRTAVQLRLSVSVLASVRG
jgi:hypothetical protein